MTFEDAAGPFKPRSEKKRGVGEYRKAWQIGFDSTEGPFEVELRELDIEASDDVAFAHALDHVSLTTTDGKHMDNWFRWTAGFRRIDGAWKIVHEQTSVPIDMEGQKAMFDLQP